MTMVFTDGSVIVGDGTVLEKATVVVEGQRIVKVSKNGRTLPRGAERIGLDGGCLLPGLIDSHVHLCGDGSPDPFASILKDSPPLLTLKTAEHARQTLLAGVTTVRDMGGAHLIDLAVRDAAASGLIQAPRILASGRVVCMTGGHGWPIGREADGPAEVRRAAREQIKAGADLVKLMATGGVMTPGVEPGSAQLTEEELRAGVEEAHKAGRRTATHAQGTEGVLNALKAGIDSVEHGFFLDDECVEIMARRGIFFVPTLAALYNIEKAGLESGVPEYMVDKARRTRSAQLESLTRAKQAGVRIAMGTDASTPFNLHGRNAQELSLLVDNGLSPGEALLAATSISAACLGLEEEVGTVEEGKLADLIVTKSNPLDDISILTQPESISLVIQAGKKVKS